MWYLCLVWYIFTYSRLQCSCLLLKTVMKGMIYVCYLLFEVLNMQFYRDMSMRKGINISRAAFEVNEYCCCRLNQNSVSFRFIKFGFTSWVFSYFNKLLFRSPRNMIVLQLKLYFKMEKYLDKNCNIKGTWSIITLKAEVVIENSWTVRKSCKLVNVSPLLNVFN